MTRINLIPVRYLLDQHLMAEYRELPMIHAALRRTLDSCKRRGVYDYKIAKQYLLGKGHVTFFYDKEKFLRQRYTNLVNELRRRGFVLNDPYDRVEWYLFEEVPSNKEWQPSNKEININLQRIIQRVEERPFWYKYKGKVLTVNKYKQALSYKGIL